MLVDIPESAGEGVSPAFNVELTLAGGRNVVHQYRGLNRLQLIQLQLNILQSKERLGCSGVLWGGVEGKILFPIIYFIGQKPQSRPL